MRLERIEFGALLSYSPYGIEKDAEISRSVRTAVKNDEFVISESKQVQMSELLGELVASTRGKLPFDHLFDSYPMLVPIPSSSLMKADSLWVPERIALALQRRKLGKVAGCLTRINPLPKSATSLPSDRSTAA